MRSTTAPCLLAVVGLVACGTPVDPEMSIDGYQAWHRVDVWGAVPGHGSSYRQIYVNEEGRSYVHSGKYPAGSIFVKEIHDLVEDEEGQAAPGDLSYIAVMRRQSDSFLIDEQYGWLFTELDEPDGSETALASCWTRCHVSAPLAGAFLDYGR